MKNLTALALAAFATLLVTACGTRGGLTLPPGPAPEPLLGHSKPASKNTQNSPTASNSDVSTDQKARPQ